MLNRLPAASPSFAAVARRPPPTSSPCSSTGSSIPTMRRSSSPPSRATLSATARCRAGSRRPTRAPPRLVAAGQGDVAITYQPDLMLQLKEGLPLVRFGTLVETPLNALDRARGRPVKTLADLKGKRIGYSVASIQSAYLSAMLDSAGTDGRRDDGQRQLQPRHRADGRPGRCRDRRLPQLRAHPAPPRGQARHPSTRRSTACRSTTS
jgi:hypothetical protein